MTCVRAEIRRKNLLRLRAWFWVVDKRYNIKVLAMDAEAIEAG